jgi:antitoxin (DNA-binding transcriptional repressor) of toxin-antitoxin stability system
MKRLKTVGVKELKNNLSAYLREVRSGATVLVSDRNNIIAELHEPHGRSALGEAVNPLLMSWAESGLVSLPAIEKVSLPVSPVKLRAGTSAELLERDREETETHE